MRYFKTEVNLRFQNETQKILCAYVALHVRASNLTESVDVFWFY